MLRIVAGQYKGKKLQTPKGLNTRPTSGRLRETVFNICQQLVEDAEVLDVFAGSGAMGIEALSRGAARATFIDRDRNASQCIKHNLQSIDGKGEVLQGEALAMLQRLKNKRFDIIYIDPPYGASIEDGEKLYAAAILEFIDANGLLSPDGTLFCEESKEASLDSCALHNLELRKIRKVGNTTLWQFEQGES